MMLALLSNALVYVRRQASIEQDLSFYIDLLAISALIPLAVFRVAFPALEVTIIENSIVLLQALAFVSTLDSLWMALAILLPC